MGWAQDLPGDLLEYIRGRVVGEYATVSGAGVPIDTPTYVFPSDDLSSIDIGTGLAYPAKAERARRNPKAGLLLEGGPDEPVVSVAGLATVRDADLQSNLERYLAETIFSPNINPENTPWADVEKMTWYLSRVLVCVTPTHIRWWRSRSAMDEPPQEWRAPAGTAAPPSDPAPEARPSEAPTWRPYTVEELKARSLTQGLPGHLTLLDADGYPLPIRVRTVADHPEGFRLDVPKGAPWSQGKATLSFIGKEIFVGDVRPEGGASIFRIERALPVQPLTDEGPMPATLATLRQRLEKELARRGKAVPVVPPKPPAPTEGAKLRLKATLALTMDEPGGGAYRE
jgi:hypothetical protein